MVKRDSGKITPASGAQNHSSRYLEMLAEKYLDLKKTGKFENLSKSQQAEYLQTSRATFYRMLQTLGTEPKKRPAAKEPKPKLSVAVQEFNEIKKKILSGQIPVGKELPKIQYYASAKNHSVNTVIQAYQLLVKNGLVRKQGKKYIAGNQSIVQPNETQDVIIVASPTWHKWYTFSYSAITSGFWYSFSQQAKSMNIQIIHFLTNEFHSNKNLLLTQRQNLFKKSLKKIGIRYQGTVFIGKKDEFQDLEMWMEAAKMFGRKCIWMDRIDSNLWNPKPWRGKNARARISENKGIKKVLQFIESNKLKHVAYFAQSHTGWESNRLDLIRNQIKTRKMNISLTAPEIVDCKAWFQPQNSGVISKIDKIHNHQPELTSHAITTLNEYRPFLRNWSKQVDLAEDHPYAALAWYTVANDKNQIDNQKIPECRNAAVDLYECLHFLPVWESKIKIDTFIFANDICAKIKLNWLNKHQIFNQLPICISFDNRMSLNLQDIYSLDFGWESLGYQCFHYLLKDISIPVTKNREIIPDPILVYRKSLI